MTKYVQRQFVERCYENGVRYGTRGADPFGLRLRRVGVVDNASIPDPGLTFVAHHFEVAPEDLKEFTNLDVSVVEDAEGTYDAWPTSSVVGLAEMRELCADLREEYGDDYSGPTDNELSLFEGRVRP